MSFDYFFPYLNLIYFFTFYSNQFSSFYVSLQVFSGLFILSSLYRAHEDYCPPPRVCVNGSKEVWFYLEEILFFCLFQELCRRQAFLWTKKWRPDRTKRTEKLREILVWKNVLKRILEYESCKLGNVDETSGGVEKGLGTVGYYVWELQTLDQTSSDLHRGLSPRIPTIFSSSS